MMSTPDDNLFQDLLSDYVAEPDDAGFTGVVMQEIEQAQKREARIRKGGLAAAFFAGGLIAGSQLKTLGEFLGTYSTPSVDFAGLGASVPTLGSTYILAAAGLVLAMGALVLMDRDAVI